MAIPESKRLSLVETSEVLTASYADVAGSIQSIEGANKLSLFYSANDETDGALFKVFVSPNVSSEPADTTSMYVWSLPAGTEVEITCGKNTKGVVEFPLVGEYVAIQAKYGAGGSASNTLDLDLLGRAANF